MNRNRHCTGFRSHIAHTVAATMRRLIGLLNRIEVRSFSVLLIPGLLSVTIGLRAGKSGRGRHHLSPLAASVRALSAGAIP
jgi:hypothetical protein